MKVEERGGVEMRGPVIFYFFKKEMKTARNSSVIATVGADI